ncbi:MAG: 5'/3'-nucleotidase SurE [Proteobacteria bacterium]|nr:5'/3'-nucleotidase SurE [Pseudomonadota bacterium]
MFEPIRDLGSARILVTNDDGILAPGLAAMVRVARALCRDVWVVAPEVQQSAASHSLTVRSPLRLRRLGPRRFAVEGTPTDCVLMALNHVLKDRPPALVLSGVNRGANLGEDVIYSGTVAAALEAALLGARAIAFSLAVGNGAKARWGTVEAHAPELVRRLARGAWARDVIFNVNVPDRAPDRVTGVRTTVQGRRQVGLQIDSRVDPDGRPYFWIVDYSDDAPLGRGSDLKAVHEGAISVTPLCLDLTHRPSLGRLREGLA